MMGQSRPTIDLRAEPKRRVLCSLPDARKDKGIDSQGLKEDMGVEMAGWAVNWV
jgi:hypothetical protein